uniref:septin-4 isoform X2 n=1 Tax=Callithrix jacchus TaxID=9483 RepID=UPI0023DCF505|nr:septin-4 isoform X2 [Callithrix jacchus]
MSPGVKGCEAGPQVVTQAPVAPLPQPLWCRPRPEAGSLLPRRRSRPQRSALGEAGGGRRCCEVGAQLQPRVARALSRRSRPRPGCRDDKEPVESFLLLHLPPPSPPSRSLCSVPTHLPLVGKEAVTPASLPGGAQIKRFLEDTTDDGELSKFMKDFSGSESCHPPEAKTWASRPQAPDLYDDDLEFRPPSWPQSSDSQQYFCAPAPLSPSARPRSPWGKLDPCDSSEDDKEYVGFATLPNQVHRKSMKKGLDFTLMVAGESGLGKSTLVNSLFLTDLYRDRKLLGAEERIMQTVEITKHAVDIEEKGVRLRLTIVDTPGFGDAVNNTECWKPVAEYIDQQFEQYFRDESGLNRKNIQDNRVHCCLYFISPFGHGLRPLDVEFMKALHQRVNIVPILAKADTLTPPEVDCKKRKIREEIECFGIKIYQFPDCDSDEDEDFKLQNQALKESIPFAVIGSNTVVEARGRRVQGRLYPWGIVEVENPGHCDFVKLRTMLVRTHMQDLKDVTRETHYENYRAQCIQSITRLVKERNRKVRSRN